MVAGENSSMTHKESRHIVVMGVSGTGKTSIAKALEQELGLVYAEGDEFHSEENVAKMHSGTPLNDDDRAPWLASIAVWMTEQAAAGHNTVVTCSALKRKYRDILRAAEGQVVFVHLTGSIELLAERMDARVDHFMPSSLLGSQFATLEPLGDNEDGLVVDVAGSKEEVATEVLEKVSTL